MKKERKHNYVVGYKGEGQCVYGRQESKGAYTENIAPMTPFQARRMLKKMRCANACIFKLVPTEAVQP